MKQFLLQTDDNTINELKKLLKDWKGVKILGEITGIEITQDYRTEEAGVYLKVKELNKPIKLKKHATK